MANKMRATYHSGRTRRDGSVFNPEHNSRKQKGIEKAEHIDRDKTANNVTATRYKGVADFVENERRFYEEHFQKGLEAQNARYIRNRHKNLVTDMDGWRTSPRHCPEESIVQIGSRSDGVDLKTFRACLREQLCWERDTFPQVKTLDWAIHTDEPGAAIHAHVRRVYIGHDKEGNEIPNQQKALEEMGLKLPKHSKGRSRYNNLKMTYTAAIREHWIAVLREHGLKIEQRPLEASKSGLSLDEFKAAKAREEVAAAEKQKADIFRDIDNAKKHHRARLNEYADDASELGRQKAEFNEEMERTEKVLDEREEQLRAREAAVEKQANRVARLAAEVAEKEDFLSTREEGIEARTRLAAAVDKALDGRRIISPEQILVTVVDFVKRNSVPDTPPKTPILDKFRSRKERTRD